jgi:putative holliday junction resolvase
MKTNNIQSIVDFKTNIESKSRLIGIDPGGKNIGIAICDENHLIATPLKTLYKNKFENLAHEINEIISENNVKGLIVGNPLKMDGTIGKSSQSALDFAKTLSKYITIPVAMWDERLSSEGSFKMTKDLGVNISRTVKNLDKNAAAFILQGAIDFLSN